MVDRKRYVDIRSNGGGVIGRVHEFSKIGEELIISFKGSTRKHVIKKLKKKYPTATRVHFNHRGKTYF